MKKLQSIAGSDETDNQNAMESLPTMTTALQLQGGKPLTRKVKMKIGKKRNTRKLT